MNGLKVYCTHKFVAPVAGYPLYSCITCGAWGESAGNVRKRPVVIGIAVTKEEELKEATMPYFYLKK